MSRQVVKPAVSVTSAFRAPCSAAWPGVVFNSSSSQCTPVLVRCVCRSISPGSSVAPPRSMTRAPAGIARPAPTASIRSPRTSTTAGAIGAPPRPSMRRAARTAMTGGAGCLRAEDATGAAIAKSCFMTVNSMSGLRTDRFRRDNRRIMPIGTAVHERTFALAESLNYREWSGYYAVSAYETHHEHEYNAIRNASALIDVSPLFKYRVSGRDAVRLVDRVITRDASKLAVGQVYYTPWCDEQGKVIDDGTVTRLSEDVFRWTAADPSLRWLTQNAIGLDVAIEDISEQVAALALQGPTSGRLLDAVADADIRSLKYFRMTRGAIAGVPVEISRTGYTGDLGYEIWMPWDRAVDVWDALMLGGRPFDIHPAGMLALDVARVEAGLLLIDVDFHGSKKALIEPQKYTPFEMGLGRLVQLDAGPFVGRAALARERAAPAWRARSSASRSAGPPSRSCTIGSASRRRCPPPRRATAVPVYQERPPGRPRDDDDVVAGVEEADRARDGRSPAFRRGDRRSRSRSPSRQCATVSRPRSSRRRSSTRRARPPRRPSEAA